MVHNHLQGMPDIWHDYTKCDYPVVSAECIGSLFFAMVIKVYKCHIHVSFQSICTCNHSESNHATIRLIAVYMHVGTLLGRVNMLIYLDFIVHVHVYTCISCYTVVYVLTTLQQ